MKITIDVGNKLITINGETSLLEFLKFIETSNLEKLDEYTITSEQVYTYPYGGSLGIPNGFTYFGH